MNPRLTTPHHSPRPLTSRLYEDEDDLRQMQELLMQARAETADWRYAHVGELLWNFFMVVCHLDPQEFVRLWHDGAGRLAGFAILGEDPSIDWQVLRAYEWTGIEAEAMDWVGSRLAELRLRDPERWGGHLASGARQDDTRRIMFLEHYGFRYSGEFAEVNMLRSLDRPVPEPTVPAGWEVRAVRAEAGDIARRAAAQREVWQPWTVGNVSAEDYAAFMQLPGFRGELDIAAVAPDGTIAAYMNGWLDPVNRIGDIGPVGALPAYRRQGLTRAVLLEGLRRMRAAGMDRACISTGETNTPARCLYESIGFEIVNRYLDFVKPAG